MGPKESLEILILSLNKIYISNSRNFFFKKIISQKKVFIIDNFICINGFFASGIFLFPLQITSLFNLFGKFIFINSNEFFLEKFEKKKNIFLSLNNSWSNVKKYFPQINILESKRIGQMCLIEGIILQVNNPMIKKIINNKLEKEKKAQIFKTNLSKIKEIKKKKPNFSKTKKNYLIKYQEAEISVLKYHFDLKKSKISSNFFVFFVGKMVGKCVSGKRISILGIIKRKNSNSLLFLKKKIKINFIMEAIFLKIEKKKNIKKRIKKFYNLPFINFGNIWQDSKIRGYSYLTRNSFFVSFLPKNELSFYSKFILLLSLVGGCTQLNFNDKEIRGSFNCCIIQKSKAQKISFLQEFHKFWGDCILISNLKYKKQEMEITTSKSKFEFYSKINIFSKSGVIFFDNYPTKTIETKNFGIFKKNLKKIQINFYESDQLIKFRTMGSIFAIVNNKLFIKKNYQKSIKFFLSNGFFSDEFKVDFYKFTKIFDTFFFLDNSTFFCKENFFSSPNLFVEKIPRSIFDCFSYELKKIFRVWSSDSLNCYIIFSKSFVHPILEKKAENYLVNWYINNNKNFFNFEKKIIIFEKLVRMTQANARIFWKNTATVQDCLVSVFIMNNFFFLIEKIIDFYQKSNFFSHKISSINSIKNFQKIASKHLFNSSCDFFTLSGGNLTKSKYTKKLNKKNKYSNIYV